jgi:cytochrome c551/c552
MKTGAIFALAALGAAAHAAAQTPPASPETALVRQYCAGCHSERGKAGGISLATFDAAAAPQHADLAEKMIRKLRAGMMPPPGARRPDEATLLALAGALETSIDKAAAVTGNPGRRPFQRLNRVEYARAVKDLLALDLDVNGLLPPDTISQGFDNVADSQPLSAALMEGYLRAASRVTALAIGDPDAESSEAHYRVPKTASQLRRVEGAPLGTRGGVAVTHTFPADGDYVFRIELHGNADGFLFGGPAAGEQIDLSINGERKALLDVDPNMAEVTTSLFLKTPPIHVAAGPQRIAAAFIQRFEGPVNDLIAPIDHTLADTQIGVAYGITTLPHLKDLAILGPQRVTGVSSTPSRDRIFVCRPTTASDEQACASKIVKGLAAQAFRHPPSQRDLDTLMRFYADGRTERDFESGIAAALEAILASPQFVFRVESAPARPESPRASARRVPARTDATRASARAAAAGPQRERAVAGRAGAERVSDIALASRLSFFLWATAPDADLTTLAMQGRLTAPGMLEKQVARLLADPRAESLSTRFAAQWLRLNDVDAMLPDAISYPYYDHTLGEAFVRETELFFQSIVRDDRSVLDLLTADYSYVNERIARHYGIADVTGPAFRRVALPEMRRGLLGQGSVLVLTSVADRTSPVMRGKWIMEVLLGSPPPPPPENVPALEATSATAGGKLLSTRERMEEHRKNPACVSCHRVIDPLGLALDNFDVTGKWRIKDNGVPVDSAGVMYDGTRIDGPASLRSGLLKHQDVFLQVFTENLMTYALGRRVEYFDMPAVRAIVRQAGTSGLRFSSFVLGIVNSDAFQRRTVEPPQNTAQAR